MIVAKQRHGPIGIVRLSFEGQFTKFGNLPAEEEGPAVLPSSRAAPMSAADQAASDAAQATRRAGAILTVDLGAIAANWRGLRDAGRADGKPIDCAAVLKADAYGTGATIGRPAACSRRLPAVLRRPYRRGRRAARRRCPSTRSMC